MSFESVDPATGKTIDTFSPHTSKETIDIVEKTHRAQKKWAGTPFEQRAQYMRNTAELLEERAPEHAEIMAREMGKPLGDGVSEAEKCAWVCEYYADHAAEFLTDDPRKSGADRSYVTYQPLGIVLAIMPWNFPYWQVFRFAAPNLMAGNGALLKHAPNVTQCALEIESLFREAGFPEQLFRTLILPTRDVQTVIEDERVRGVTLTGSTRAGRAVASGAGGELKKTVLELGGSDPYLILDDADLETAAETCVTSRLINSGQSCIAAKRFIVVEDRHDQFVELVTDRMQQITMGNPLEDDVDLGPQARDDLRQDLHRQVTESVRSGARCVMGGEIPSGPGYFYPPTVLTQVGPGMPAYEEELFGPVASVIEVEDEQEAVRVANDSPYGLGGAVFTEDVERGERIASEQLEAGCCFVNAFVRSDPRLPFGGIKNSGYGRELSREGIREFVNVKTVYVTQPG